MPAIKPTLVSLLLLLPAAACRKSNDDSKGNRLATPSDLQSVINKPIVLKVPDTCPEGEDPALCTTWLGLNTDGRLGLTHVWDRVTFALEDMTNDGRFHLAVYPDCELDARAAAEAAAVTPEQGDEVDPEDIGETTAEILEIGENEDIPSLLEDATATVTADPAAVAPELPPLATSPLAACKRMLVPGPKDGDPVELIDPSAAVDADSLWRLIYPEDGHPIFASEKACEVAGCFTRLLLGEDHLLAAVDARGDSLMLKSFWNKLVGKVSQGFEAIEQGVADVKKTVGTSVSVEDLGGKKLYISAATGGVRMFSAIKEEGAAALAEADGRIVDGTVYMKAGGKYIEEGGKFVIDNAQYVVEYIVNNACYLMALGDLTARFGDIGLAYEAALQAGAIDFYNKAMGPEAYKEKLKHESSLEYTELRLAIIAFALYASAYSGKFNLDEWEDLVMDIVIGGFEGNIRAGYVPLIFSKVARTMCKGTKESLSSAHALVHTATSDGISDDCFHGIQDRATRRYEENAEDICYATQDEIKLAAAASASSGRGNAWSEGDSACPNDPSHDAYLNLLEGLGCIERRFPSGAVGEQDIADETLLTRQRYWGRTTNFKASVACPAGSVAVGVCGSGGNSDCYDRPKEILCASRTDGAIVDNKKIAILRKDETKNSAMCPNNYVLTEFCSSGGNRDCDNRSLVARCAALQSKFMIDYGNCEMKESKAWHGRLDATQPNHVVVGLCTSGKFPDCGKDDDVTKSALFCPLILRANDPGMHQVFRFYKSYDYNITTDLGEPATGYYYEGAKFRLYDQAGTGRTALYRCSTEYTHFATKDKDCEGFKNRGILGYADDANGTKIYRCERPYTVGSGLNVKVKPHYMITTDKKECDDEGYTVHSELGFAP